MLEPIFGRGNVIILDSGFCILKGIVELRKHGVHASTLIEKWKYWLKYIKGELIKAQMWAIDSWKGLVDEVNFHIYAMKEPNYVMSLMSMYGMNLQGGKET